MEFDRVEARWKGTTDLDRDAVKAMNLDGLAFFVVGCRVEKMELSVNKQGETVRKDVLDVSDVRALLGNHRSMAVDFLSGEPSVNLAVEAGQPDASGADGQEVNDRSVEDFVELTDMIARILLPFVGENDWNLEAAEQIAHAVEGHHITGPRLDMEAVEELKAEVRREVYPDEFSEPEPEGVIASIYDYKKSAPVEATPSGGGGPKVLKYNPAAADDGEPVETVKTVGKGRNYKDPALARFMED